MQTLTIRRPDDWHVHLRDGDDAARRSRLHRAAVRAGDRHAQPRAAGDDASTAAAAYRDRIVAAAGAGFTPLMTCYLTDEADPDEIARGFERRRVDRRQALSGRRDDQQRQRRHRHPQHPSGARADAGDRHGAAASTARSPTRTSTCSTARRCSSTACSSRWSATFPALKIVLRAYHDRRGGRFRRATRRPNVAATVTPQHLHINRNALFAGGLAAARLLPAGRQARGAPARGAQGGDLGLAQILPRHRQRAARARAPRNRLRLRRHLQRAVRARKLCDGVRGGRRARPVRGLRLGAWRRASTACRSTRAR